MEENKNVGTGDKTDQNLNVTLRSCSNFVDLLISPKQFFLKQRNKREMRDPFFFALTFYGFAAFFLTLLQVKAMTSQLFHPLELFMAPGFFCIFMCLILGGLFAASALFYSLLWLLGSTKNFSYVSVFGVLCYSHVFMVFFPLVLLMSDTIQFLAQPAILCLTIAYRYLGFRYSLGVSFGRLTTLFLLEVSFLVSIAIFVFNSLP